MLKIYKISTVKARRNIILYMLILVTAFTSVSIFFTTQQQASPAAAASCGGIYDPLPSIITSKVNRNKAIYQQVAMERGVPWEILAAIHYRETNNSRVNPGNNQGIYQLYSIYNTNSAYQALARSSNGNEVSEANFLEQTRFAADFIQGKAQSSGTSLVSPRRLTTNETSINLIKNTLYSYNGRASAYANQAASYGYNASSQPFEGSPYVMNNFDCQRRNMGIITCDGCGTVNGTDTRFGAFTLYARLKGDSYWLSLIKKAVPACNTTKVDCVWEFENEDTGKRFYTSSISERDAVNKLNYQSIGIAFHLRNNPSSGTTPVYRVYHLREGWHFWTSSLPEKNSLVATGNWRDEGVVFQIDPPESNTGDPVSRLYTTSNGGKHILTSNGQTIQQLEKRGYKNEGRVFTSVSTNVQASIPAPNYQNVYRFQLRDSHFWTTSVAERNALINRGEIYEDVGWETPKSSPKPTYRLYSPEGVHFWTASAEEKSILLRNKWKDEGIGWSSGQQSDEVYRLYNQRTGRHFWTASNQERTILQNNTWSLEGTAWLQR